MSILIVRPDRETGQAIVERLVAEGDEVRVITDKVTEADLWKNAGAHVAIGDLMDPDLIERAAQGCRTVVVMGGYEGDAILSGARAARVGRAIVLVRDRKRAAIVLERTGSIHEIDHVILTTTRRGFPLSTPIAPGEIAEAVSAADDLAGNPKLLVDVATDEGRRLLGLQSS